MAKRASPSWFLILGVFASILIASACTPSSPTPTAAPAKPAAAAGAPAQPTAAPAAQAAPAKPTPQPVLLRAGAPNTEDQVTSTGLAKFAELVNQKAKGAITVQLSYMSYGGDQQLAEAVMSGSVDIGNSSNGNLGRFTDAFMLWDLPFLFKTYDSALQSLDTTLGRNAIEKFEKDMGVKSLWPESYGLGRDIQSAKKQLKVPADIKGMKIRTVSTPVDLATFKAWGANPTPVDWGQTYSAIQQGIVDGCGIPLVNVLTSKFYEITKYTVRVNYQAVFQPAFINAKKFASLSPENQQIIMDAAKEAKAWNYKNAVDRADSEIKQLIDVYKHVVYTPAPAEYDQWASVRETVWKQVAEEQKGKIDLAVANQLYASQ